MSISPTDEFWDLGNLDLEDPLNREIWASSPDVQRRIQPPSALGHVGAIGAQQAMLPTTFPCSVLPWVPDLVGRAWQDPDSLLIVGSAYAGFIREFSTRALTLTLHDYADAVSVQDFQQRFLKRVVLGDHSYYRQVAALASGVGNASRVALLDLCRASFVRRGADSPAGRIDEGGDSVVRASAQLYAQYVETPIASDWTWQRLVGGKASRILALGSIAEHGLIRLFCRHGMHVRVDGALPVGKSSATTLWPRAYAEPTRCVNSWTMAVPAVWWTITGELEGARREWRVLPVRHPSARAGKGDTMVANTKRIAAALSAMSNTP